MSVGISLPICTKASILELLAVPAQHGSVASIGGEHRYGLLIGLRKYAGYALDFVRGDPSLPSLTEVASVRFLFFRNPVNPGVRRERMRVCL